MTSPINDQIEDQIFMSELDAGAYTPTKPQQGESKSKKRRKKNKERENGSKDLKKRKLSAEQVMLLEMNFGNEHKLESERKDRLASELGLDPRQVAVWFQNRRARWKNKKLEEEYANLNKLHETAVLDKCRLESETIKLKEQLCGAEKEIQRLSEKLDGLASNSPSPSLSVEAIDPPFLGDFGVQGYDADVFYMSGTNYMNGMEWFSLYM